MRHRRLKIRQYIDNVHCRHGLVLGVPSAFCNGVRHNSKQCSGEQEAQLSLTNRAGLFFKVVEVLQDFLSENEDKKFTTDYNVG